MDGKELAHVKAGEVDRSQITGEMVTQALVKSLEFLEEAMRGTDPTPIAEFKAWAATVEEATRQKKLGREIELDAAEMVRRAERGLGVVIRNGQAEGVLPTTGQGTAGAFGPGGRERRGPDSTRSHIADLLPHGSERAMTYAVTDDVTDEQFETALTAAKQEGNLSRRNVVRKVKAQTTAFQSRKQRAQRIAELAEQGYSSRQMSGRVGVSEETVRLIARDFGLTIHADKTMGKTRRHDSNRIAQETVNALEGLAMGVDLIAYDGLDRETAAHWATSLDASMRTLNRFRKQIKEMTQ